MLVVLSRQNHVAATNICHDKRFVATKIFCCHKHNFVATKMILAAAPANDKMVLSTPGPTNSY